jgi:hypothetical protein
MGYVTGFHVGQHIQQINGIYPEHKEFKKQDEIWHPIQEHKNYTSIYTKHDTLPKNTECKSFSPTRCIYFIIFILQYIFPSKHYNIPVKCSNILHLLVWMPLNIPFSK